MFTLALIVCHMKLATCVYLSPHSSPYRQPVYETFADCEIEGEKLKGEFLQAGDVKVKFTCTNWKTGDV